MHQLPTLFVIVTIIIASTLARSTDEPRCSCNHKGTSDGVLAMIFVPSVVVFLIICLSCAGGSRCQPAEGYTLLPSGDTQVSFNRHILQCI
ncbi:hypothetical protein BDY19DRAFT_964193 [Irpex rosettiformis]|uniref:Uncharacterized protein n=1 Tax=Irpex rosettiformis TaxID=378272 RepID=A0ACB8TUP3_9APHY|nr:hypothetical protein BDY19DRAFT_964193 [Irpex rosettiformis]